MTALPQSYEPSPEVSSAFVYVIDFLAVDLADWDNDGDWTIIHRDGNRFVLTADTAAISAIDAAIYIDQASKIDTTEALSGGYPGAGLWRQFNRNIAAHRPPGCEEDFSEDAYKGETAQPPQITRRLCKSLAHEDILQWLPEFPAVDDFATVTDALGVFDLSVNDITNKCAGWIVVNHHGIPFPVHNQQWEGSHDSVDHGHIPDSLRAILHKSGLFSPKNSPSKYLEQVAAVTAWAYDLGNPALHRTSTGYEVECECFDCYVAEYPHHNRIGQKS